MKKYLILLLASVVALVSCETEIIDSENGKETAQTPLITFNLTANRPDATKAVKSDWESGDAVFVFFNTVEAPKYLKMSYDGSAWTSVEMDGTTASLGCLGLKNGDSVQMRAIFLPFGSNADVVAEGSSFTFSTIYYAYYLTAQLSCTVENNEINGAFDMMIPDDYVQFFVEDASAVDEGYSLGTDAVIPVGVASISSTGTVVETSDKSAGDYMTGYAYNNGIAPKGYLFSGKISGNYHSYQYNGSATVEAGAYYFSKMKAEDGSRTDYFVAGKSLASHSSVRLPANNDVYAVLEGSPNTGKWVPVGKDVVVELFGISDTPPTEVSCGKWYTCNYNQSVPEAKGSIYNYGNANNLGVKMPTKSDFELISSSGYCSWTWLTVHGQQGAVVKADRGFLFLPALYNDKGGYWSSSPVEGASTYYFLRFFNTGEHWISKDGQFIGYSARAIQE